MISFDEATAIIAGAARPVGRENVALAQAHGRVLASDVIARIDAPRRDVSAMDGYAVRDADLAAIRRLKLIGESAAGQVELPKIGPGECVRIFTGGAIPPGADRVVVQEIVDREGEWATVTQAPGPTTHIRRRGSDFKSGERLLVAGTLLGPRALVAAAAADVRELEVYRSPRVVIVATGDELAEPGAARDHPAAIPESVSFGAAALCEQWGGTCAGRMRLPDDPAQLEHGAMEALENADLVVVTGGASVGERDFGKSMFAAIGLDVLFSKVAIKPGKPVWLGRAREKLVLGLPGNPTSAMVTARLFLAPLLAGMSGRSPTAAHRWMTARLSVPVPACGDRETLLRARWSGDAVEPLAFEDSGAQKVLAEAQLLVRRAPHSPALAAGEVVPVLDF